MKLIQSLNTKLLHKKTLWFPERGHCWWIAEIYTVSLLVELCFSGLLKVALRKYYWTRNQKFDRADPSEVPMKSKGTGISVACPNQSELYLYIRVCTLYYYQYRYFSPAASITLSCSFQMLFIIRKIPYSHVRAQDQPISRPGSPNLFRVGFVMFQILSFLFSETRLEYEKLYSSRPMYVAVRSDQPVEKLLCIKKFRQKKSKLVLLFLSSVESKRIQSWKAE